MEENHDAAKITIRDFNEKRDIMVMNTGEFLLGLSSDGSLEVKHLEEKSDICMPLLHLVAIKGGGCTLAPVNSDLPCTMVSTGELLTGEINLVPGMRLEIADKLLAFFDGPVPKLRRQLPRTPGLPTEVQPPPKPPRAIAVGKLSGEEHMGDVEDTERKWLTTSWCFVQLPSIEQQTIESLSTPDQVSIMAGSFFVKQLQMYTDASPSMEYLDQIFQFFKEVGQQLSYPLMDYLVELSDALSKTNMDYPRPMHGPAIKLIVELLRCYLPSLDYTLLCMKLLRTFSHFDDNLVTLVNCGAAAKLLGSMSAYQGEAELQLLGLDILGRLAKYKPHPGEKAPLREATVEFVVRALQNMKSKMEVCRSGCRVLANLSTTFMDLLNHYLDIEAEQPSPVILSDIDKYDQLLVFLFGQTIPSVQDILQKFPTDLGVVTEGRRLLYTYAKFPQLQQKEKLWRERQEVLLEQVEEGYEIISHGPIPDSVSELVPRQLPLSEIQQGILKPSRSFETCHSSDRKIKFSDEVHGESSSSLDDSHSDSYCSEKSDSSGCLRVSQPVMLENENEGIDQFAKSLSIKKYEPHQEDSSGESTDPDDVFLDVDGERMKSKKQVRKRVLHQQKCEVFSPSEKENFERQSPSHFDVTVRNGETKENQVHVHGDEIRTPTDFITTRVPLDSDEQLSHQGHNIGHGSNPFSGAMSDLPQVSDRHSTFSDTSIIFSETDERQIINDEESCDSEPVNVPNREEDSTVVQEKDPKEGQDPIRDIPFWNQLVFSQVIVYVSSLVLQEDEQQALLVIDQPVKMLIQKTLAPYSLIKFACRHYSDSDTLMDLDPAVVISIIDAVRYRSLIGKLLQTALLNVIQKLGKNLHAESVSAAMMFIKTTYGNSHFTKTLSEEEFVQKFRSSFRRATEGLSSADIETARKELATIL
ncbi:hypothetical protein CHS0354_008880 [Potamilus streckersoni]|uniref:Uncharacterized protein n=1 Tax=Potamilus streckersoni TaxID=2493646 RepID=A0AAE0TC69_9BIVA|nr:hypothetical protein CHS0354_008880 [Potamilus streckersoni]